MLLYWRIQQDLNALGENLIFHEPSFKRCLRIWMKKNATGIALAQECDQLITEKKKFAGLYSSRN